MKHCIASREHAGDHVWCLCGADETGPHLCGQKQDEKPPEPTIEIPVSLLKGLQYAGSIYRPQYRDSVPTLEGKGWRALVAWMKEQGL
jgi:hypothetical protein